MDGLLTSSQADSYVVSPTGDALVVYDPTCASACCTTSDDGYLEARVCDGVTPLARRVFVATPVASCFTWQVIANPHPCYTVYPGISRVYTTAEVAAANGIIEVPPANSQGQTCCACHPPSGDTGCAVVQGTWVPIYNCADPRPPDQPWICCVSVRRHIDSAGSISFHKRVVSAPGFINGQLVVVTTTDDYSATGTAAFETDATGNVVLSTDLFLNGSRTTTSDNPNNPFSNTIPITFSRETERGISGYPYSPDDCSSSSSVVDTGGTTITDSRTVVRDWSCAGYTFTRTTIHNTSNPNGAHSEQTTVEVYSAAWTYLGPPCGSGGCTGPGGAGPGGASGGIRIPPVTTPDPVVNGQLPSGDAAALLFLRGA